MNAEAFISDAIARGGKDGMHAVTGKARVVHLVSEVEVLCDMEGIDTVLDRIEEKRLAGVGEAFAAIGATEIASALQSVERTLPHRDYALLKRANDLITSREGYSYESVKRYVDTS